MENPKERLQKRLEEEQRRTQTWLSNAFHYELCGTYNRNDAFAQVYWLEGRLTSMFFGQFRESDVDANKYLEVIPGDIKELFAEYLIWKLQEEENKLQKMTREIRILCSRIGF